VWVCAPTLLMPCGYILLWSVWEGKLLICCVGGVLLPCCYHVATFCAGECGVGEFILSMFLQTVSSLKADRPCNLTKAIISGLAWLGLQMVSSLKVDQPCNQSKSKI